MSVGADQERGLVPADLAPGLIPIGFAEDVLVRARAMDDPAQLWDGATTLGAAAQKWNGLGRQNAELKSAQMYCEILLGQMLGPSPGDYGKGSWARGESAHAHSAIPKEIVRDLRRLYGWLDRLVQEVREGARSRRQLLLAVDRWESDGRPEPKPSELDIRRGDFREVLADIAPGSVALVLTDPPYPAEYLPLWDALGVWSAESLVDGGSLVAYSGQSHLPEVFERLSLSLRYWWTLALVHGQSQMIPGKFVSAGWKPLVWYVREHRAGRSMLPDCWQGSGKQTTVPAGDDGSWAQGVAELESIISGLTAPGDLIVDPFAGSGSVGVAAHRFGRRFIGAEIGG